VNAAAPPLAFMAQVRCEVGPLLSLGQTPAGERRVVPLTGGEVDGPELRGRIEPGGSDWQWLRADGVLEIAAHYLVVTPDGARIEVRSEGLRHGPADVMAALARGESVAPNRYFFRTRMRFQTGHADWLQLNRVMAIAAGQRLASRVILDVWRLA
jgi:hypothetical protein